MKNKSKSMKRVSEEIISSTKDAQEKNKSWWESLPMTYADWDSEKRIPKTKEDFLQIEKIFLEGNPFLKNDFYFNSFKGKKVLEVGCGSGAASCLFAKGGANVTAIDITENSIKIAKENSRLQKVKINFLQMDAEKINLQKDYFDYIFSWGVLHHSKNTINAFRGVYKILNKNGSGLIMVYNKNSLRYYLNGIYWLLIKGKIFKGYNLKSVQSFYTDGFYHRHFTKRELKKELEKIGFKKLKFSITHMGTKMIPFLPKSIVDKIKSKLGWLLVVEFKK